MLHNIRILVNHILHEITEQLIQTVTVDRIVFLFCHDPAGFQGDHIPVIVRVPSCHERMARLIAAEVQTDLDGYKVLLPELLTVRVTARASYDPAPERFRVVRKLLVDRTVCTLPEP